MVLPHNRFIFLDALRIFACACVYFAHNIQGEITQFANEKTFLGSLLLTIFKITDMGGSRVCVFFLVSGFIKRHNLRNESHIIFIIKRFFRIISAYSVVLFISQALSTKSIKLSVLNVPQVLLLGDYFWYFVHLGGAFSGLFGWKYISM
jgi:peptidoglycan/LPS O-acetylase OafA/YrhL